MVSRFVRDDPWAVSYTHLDVYKRQGLPYEQACARWPLSDAALAAAALSPVTRQIARELEVAMDRWLPLVPSMGIACDRVAWACLLYTSRCV